MQRARVVPALAVLLVLALPEAAIAADPSCALYLHLDGGPNDTFDPVDRLDDVAPVFVEADPVDLRDLDNDSKPGLTIKKGFDPGNPMPKHFQEWISDELAEETCLSGISKVHLFTVLRNFQDKAPGAVTVLVIDRDPLLPEDDPARDRVVGKASVVLEPWSLSGTWEEQILLFAPTETNVDPETGFPYYSIPATHRIVLKAIVGGNLSLHDLWFTYDSTDNPSRVAFASCECDNIQPPVESDGDWTIVGSDQFSALPGNVGIGTEEPSTKLQVDGGTDAFVEEGGYVTVGEETDVNLALDRSGIMARNDGTEFPLHLQADGGNIVAHARQGGTSRFILQDDGAVGIGTVNPAAKLHVFDGTELVFGQGGFLVVGDASLGNLALDGNELQARFNGGSSTLFLQQGGGDLYVHDITSQSQFVVRDNGRVGIGNNFPAGKLHVGDTGQESSIIVGSTAFPYLHLDWDGIRGESPGFGDDELALQPDDGVVTVGSTVRVDPDASGGGAGIRLANGNGEDTIILDADSSDSARITLRDSNGHSTIVLDADWDNNGADNGRVVTSVLEITGGADLSEQFDVAGGARAGMVVSIDPENPGRLVVSSEPYDRRVAGIVSGANGIRPGVLMGQRGTEADGGLPVALTGRVHCLADPSNGRIEPGDMLTSSSLAGHCMKVTRHGRARGAVIGKAMSHVNEGKVLVLVNLQ